jgi:DNA-binding Lrp family transcriptional regulator
VEKVELTAREILQKLAQDAEMQYSELADRINRELREGISFSQSIMNITIEKGLTSKEYQLNPSKIVEAIRHILREDYSQTLMISAVLSRMVDSESTKKLPVPAFLAFLEILAELPGNVRELKTESSTEIETKTTRMIELLTTLVSIICEWSKEGMVGIASICPLDLKDLARAIFRKTKMYENGLWTCISCGKVVNLQDTHALMCSVCNKGFPKEESEDTTPRRIRTGYGKNE